MSSTQTVFVVDDNPEICESMSTFLSAAKLKVETFDSAKAFLEAFRSDMFGCLILDIRMPEMSGLELQERLGSMGVSLPIIIVSGHAAVMDAVKTMKLGSFEFLEKPYSSEVLLGRVREALKHERRTRIETAQRALLKVRFELLSEREKRVMSLVISGKQSKAIADKMGLSVSTIDNHRSNIMKKLKAETSSDLTRIALLVDPSMAFPLEDSNSE